MVMKKDKAYHKFMVNESPGCIYYMAYLQKFLLMKLLGQIYFSWQLEYTKNSTEGHRNWPWLVGNFLELDWSNHFLHVYSSGFSVKPVCSWHARIIS